MKRKSAFRLPVGSGDVGAISYPASNPIAGLLLAHGAGAPQRHPYLVGTAERLRTRGISVITFDFEYADRGRKIPDRSGALEACFAAAFTAARARIGPDTPLFAGGKSMGGRIATQCAAERTIDPLGIVVFGYPLHPPGKPDQLRDAHLRRVRAPILFVQGTRDPFGGADEVSRLLPALTKVAPGTTVFEVNGGDHSHVVPKRHGTLQSAVDRAIADAVVAWVRRVL